MLFLVIIPLEHRSFCSVAVTVHICCSIYRIHISEMHFYYFVFQNLTFSPFGFSINGSVFGCKLYLLEVIFACDNAAEELRNVILPGNRWDSTALKSEQSVS